MAFVMRKGRSFAGLLLAGLALTFGAIAPVSAQPAAAHNVGEGARTWDGSPAVPVHPDQARELALKIKKPFTVVSLGDLLEFQPFADRADPDVQYLVNLIKGADIATGDLENEIYDFDNFGHYGVNLATKEVADDWARMGIDMVSRANNKDQRSPGVWENFHQVERVGIVHAGVDHSLAKARMARYRETSKGLVGFAGIYSVGGIDACCRGGQVVSVTAEQLSQVKAMKDSIVARRGEVEVPVPPPPPDADGTVQVFGVTFRSGTNTVEADKGGAERGAGRAPGAQDGVINAIHLTLYHGVTAPQMSQLRAIAGDNGSGDLEAFGTHFRVMDKPGEHSFDMDPKDEREVLTQIRTGKQASDIMITNTHWHQNRYDFQAYSYDHFPADFEIKFAHDAIDQGDDVFVAQGVHTIKGVEIYKGKPIFYGTSNFVFQNALMPLGKDQPPGETGRGERRSAGAEKDMDGPIVGEHEVQGFWQLKPNMEAIMGVSHFENGRLTEVRIYPVDLGQTLRTGSDYGIPRKPQPAVAQKILDEMIEYSKPFHTRIAVRDGVGIITIPPK